MPFMKNRTLLNDVLAILLFTNPLFKTSTKLKIGSNDLCELLQNNLTSSENLPTSDGDKFLLKTDDLVKL